MQQHFDSSWWVKQEYTTAIHPGATLCQVAIGGYGGKGGGNPAKYIKMRELK